MSKAGKYFLLKKFVQKKKTEITEFAQAAKWTFMPRITHFLKWTRPNFKRIIIQGEFYYFFCINPPLLLITSQCRINFFKCWKRTAISKRLRSSDKCFPQRRYSLMLLSVFGSISLGLISMPHMFSLVSCKIPYIEHYILPRDTSFRRIQIETFFFLIFAGTKWDRNVTVR